MDEILEKLKQQEVKLNEIATTVKKIKFYFLAVLVLSLITFILPLIGLIFVIPWFLRTMESTYQGLL